MSNMLRTSKTWKKLRAFYYRYLRRYKIIRQTKWVFDYIAWQLRIYYRYRVQERINNTNFARAIYLHYLFHKSRPFLPDRWSLPLDCLPAFHEGAEIIVRNESFASPRCFIMNSTKIPPDLAKDTIIAPPPVTRRIFQDVAAFGGTDFLKGKDGLIYLQSPDLDRHTLPEELSRFVLLNSAARKACLYKDYLPSCTLDEALHMMGATTVNYVHWITEYLPKLLLFEAQRSGRIPVLVDSGLHHNMLESMELLAETPLIFIHVERFRSVHVRKLHIIDTGAFVPFGFMNPDQPDIRDNETLFSPAALKLLRQRCQERIIQPGGQDKGRKLFVLRVSNYRAIHNINEVTGTAGRFGYEVIVTNNMSFTEQVRLFSSATHILGQTGAGIGNIVFAPPGCRIMLLATNMALGNYRYFHNIARICGHQLGYVEGQPLLADDVHSDFKVDCRILAEALTLMDSKDGLPL